MASLARRTQLRNLRGQIVALSASISAAARLPPTPPAFLPGLELSRRLYIDAVRPVLAEVFPGLRYAAARIGGGSEVLGFDTPRSVDHEWGRPRLQLFLDADSAALTGEITSLLSERLPKAISGWPTSFQPTDAPIATMARTDGLVAHRITVTTGESWLRDQLGFDPRLAISLLDWLATPTQRLAETTAGVVLHDALALLEPVRARLAWYPRDVWAYVLACQWQRIAEDEAFVARAREVGDEAGSAVIAARLIRDTMRLLLLMHRRWPPYGKWLGSAVRQLPLAAEGHDAMLAAVSDRGWQQRETALTRVYVAAARTHNALGPTSPLDPTTRPYHDRPYQVQRADRFAAALRASIVDPAIRRLPTIGAIDQVTDNLAVLEPGTARGLLRSLMPAAALPPGRPLFDSRPPAVIAP